MWTTLHLLRLEQRLDSIACYQMSGLLARGKPAGRDGVRYAGSKHMGDIGNASATFGVSRVSIDRSFHLLVPASSTIDPQRQLPFSSPPGLDPSTRHRCRPVVDASRHHQPPRDPRELVCERHRDELGWLAVQDRG